VKTGKENPKLLANRYTKSNSRYKNKNPTRGYERPSSITSPIRWVLWRIQFPTCQSQYSSTGIYVFQACNNSFSIACQSLNVSLPGYPAFCYSLSAHQPDSFRIPQFQRNVFPRPYLLDTRISLKVSIHISPG